MTKKPNLDDRIAAAFRDPSTVKAADVSDLLTEVKQALSEAQAEADTAEAVALDPALSATEAEERRTDAERAAFKLRRLHNASGRLQELLSDRQGAEAEAERWRKYKLTEDRQGAEAEAERWRKYKLTEDRRDACANLIRKKYPDIQKELMELIRAIAGVRIAVNLVNADLPDSCAPLDMPEGVALDYPDSPAGHVIGARPAQIAEMLVVDYENWSTPAWPPNWNGMVSGRIGEHELNNHLARLVGDE